MSEVFKFNPTNISKAGIIIQTSQVRKLMSKTLRKLSKIFSSYAMGFIFKYYGSGIHTNYTLVPKIYSFGHLLLSTRFSHKEEEEKKSFSLLQQITMLLANSVNAQAFTEDVYKLGSIHSVFFLDTTGCRRTKVS